MFKHYNPEHDFIPEQREINPNVKWYEWPIHSVWAGFQWGAQLVLFIILALAGWLVMVRLGLRHEVEDRTVEAPFRDHNQHRSWYHVGLPWWAWIWSNDIDGALGDYRGAWDKKTGDARTYEAKFEWLAERNPVNNRRHLVPWMGVCLYDATIEVLAGQYLVGEGGGAQNRGFQFYVARGPKWWQRYYGMYYLGKRIKDDHVWSFRIGFKTDPWYGEVYTPSSRSKHTTRQQLHANKGFTARPPARVNIRNL